MSYITSWRANDVDTQENLNHILLKLKEADQESREPDSGIEGLTWKKSTQPGNVENYQQQLIKRFTSQDFLAKNFDFKNNTLRFTSGTDFREISAVYALDLNELDQYLYVFSENDNYYWVFELKK